MCVFLTDPRLLYTVLGVTIQNLGMIIGLDFNFARLGGGGGRETKKKHYLFICCGDPATYMYVTIIIIIFLAKLNKDRRERNEFTTKNCRLLGNT